MRTMRILICDIRYQIKYGFYFLYGAISILYLGVLLVLPEDLAGHATALIILTDPAVLGFFFIGGMVLLERGEGLHSYFAILPATEGEYVMSKALSLSMISTLVAMVIAGVMYGLEVNWLLLIPGVFFGAGIFTLAGLIVGTRARSVNHYFVIGVPVGILLIAPTFLVYLDWNLLPLEILPATLLLRLLYGAIGLEVPYTPWFALGGILLWCIPVYIFARRAFARYIDQEVN